MVEKVVEEFLRLGEGKVVVLSFICILDVIFRYLDKDIDHVHLMELSGVNF